MTRFATIQNVLLILAGLNCLPAFAANNVWERFGPDGGEVRDLQSPSTSRTYATSSSLIYRSSDFGLGWRPIVNGLPLSRATEILFATSISNPDVIYAVIQTDDLVSFQRVFRSINGGDRWQRINYPRPPGSNIVDISVDPTNAQRLTITNTATGNAGIVRSDNGGVSFLVSGTGIPATSSITSSVRHGTTAYAATIPSTGGNPVMYRSSNDGATWGPAATLLPNIFEVTRVRTAPGNSATVYLNPNDRPPVVCIPGIEGGCSSGGFSNNGGNSWIVRNSFQFIPWISSISPNRALFANGNSVQFTGDGGLNTSVKFNLANASRVVAVPNYDPAVSTSTAILAGSVDRGLLRTTNDGVSTQSANNGFFGKDIISLALTQSTVAGYTLLAGVASEVNTNGVNSRFIPTVVALPDWVERPVETLFSKSVTALAADPTTAARLYAGNDLNQLLRSQTGGSTWGAVATPTPGIGSVHAIALDPRSCVSPPSSGPCTSGPLTTIYIGGDASPGATPGANSASIYKSVNSGASFSAASFGINLATNADSRLRITDIEVDPNNSANLFASLAVFGTGTRGTGASGIYFSTNGGASWNPANIGIPSAAGGGASARADVWALEYDPTDSAVLYAAVTDSLVNPGAVSGIYRTTNSGLTWTQIGPRRYAARDIAINPAFPDRIYVAVSGNAANPGGVLRSVDAGETWQSISNGLEAGGVFKLVTRGNLLFGASKTGVFSYTQGPDVDLDNVETPVEDAAPNTGDLNGDGILDSTQGSSSSFLIKTAGPPPDTEYRIPEGRTNYGNVDDTGATEDSRGGGDECGRLNNVFGIDSALYPEDIGPSGIQYDSSDLGLVNLEYNNCASATVIVTFDDGNFTDSVNWVWRNYSPTVPGDSSSFGWYTFPGAQRLDSKRWQLTINANQLGVYRADADSLLLRGGPAFFPERVLTNGFE